MKRLLVVIFALLIAINISADIKRFHIELIGGFSTLRMAEYNDDMSDVDSFYALYGFDSKLNAITAGILLDSVLLAELDKGWGFYLKTDYMLVGEDHNVVNFPDGTNYLANFVNFDHIYTGLGVRKYFKDYWDTHMIRPYAAIDLGAVWTVNNFMKTRFYYPDGSEEAFIEEYVSGILFGGCVEAGADYWMTENLGLILKAGYRVSLGKLQGKHRDSRVIGETNTDQPVDFSGLYLSFGMGFGF